MEGEKEKNGEHEKLIAFPPKNIETEQKTVRKRGPKKQVTEETTVNPLIQPLPQIPVTRGKQSFIAVPDGKGGYRLVPPPVIKPTVWFNYSTKLPYWSIKSNINVLYWLIVVAGFILRFWRIDWPNCVVFDEVHFGKFASYYLTRTFFFDVHPPLGKLIFAAIGYWNDFDGSFLFKNIGEEFPSDVPYVIMRGSSALCGSLLIPTVYQIMIELGFTHRAALLASFFTLLDNALQIQSRVIMLDSFVVFFTYLSILGYLKVYHCRLCPYSQRWHGWMIATGVSLGLLLGVKYTGLVGLGCVGLLALCDIWQIVGDLAVDKWPEPNPPLHKDLIQLFTHMAYRGIYLLGIPLLMSFALFYMHFTILTKAGPGNAFVSIPFQDTLEGTPPPSSSSPTMNITSNATLLRYNSLVTFRNQDHNCWIHSHKDLYPLKYPDGRGSSYQQQVTCYEFEDRNNYWAVRKPGFPDDVTLPNDTSPIRNKDIVEFVHVSTQKLLNSHDVAAPLNPANQEVAAYVNYSSKFIPYLKWKIVVQGLSDDSPIFWTPGKLKLKLIHDHSGQAMSCSGNRLPEWGFEQYEVVTDKAVDVSNTLWILDQIKPPNSTEEMLAEEEELRNASLTSQNKRQSRRERSNNTTPYSFWEKYFEMQGRMLAAHGNLGDHQFGATPIQWPLLGKTLPYWLHNKTNAQLTLIGNPILWWISSVSIVLFFFTLIFYILRRRRKITDLPDGIFQQWLTSGLVLIIGWAAHYLPYFILYRVLFLHHYLPALPFKFMVLAAMCEHGFLWANKSKLYPKLVKLVYQLFIAVICLLVTLSFILYAPFTFGYPALSTPRIKSLAWISTWDLLMRETKQ